MRKLIDVTGRIYGRLTVIERAPNMSRQARWKCLCACGSVHVAGAGNLRSGRTQSCGCLQGTGHGTHGHTRNGNQHPLYSMWTALKGRCTNPNDAAWERYGGRGITVDPRWLDFSRFLADMGPKPSPNHSIDRIDNNGPYSPENCRWATPKEQAANRRPLPCDHGRRVSEGKRHARERRL